MEIPNHLKHTPILKVENYDKIDGPYRNETDAKGLSLGLAQWRDSGDDALSVKIWRYTGEKWSRQSEEIPLHRVIDLATLVCSAISCVKNGNFLNNSDFIITKRLDENLISELTEKLNDNYIKQDLDEPLKRLALALKNIGY
ncbi:MULTISPECIES: DUF6530 family protein [Glaesserella]|uniref:Uncharacterized protein n=1 Tax=Glaesserella australis TaxID=2094024 RepID=A0A328C3S0_9PAST|nr:MULTISPECIES: DUF6530 family protein [Glaesserella]AUI66881.1 hypothetical protein CJD39_09970 [Glaesserella sp. 15-184]RAL19932.1 hypothetical protein C5N92_00740 [Glaesserella australis]